MFRSAVAVRLQIPGAGLGLPIALAIVKAHHGTITVPSSGPEGTTFRVLLPC
jgi:signal transduction histidine kinase